MSTKPEQFDKDMVLFDASATLTYFRSQKKIMPIPAIMSVETRDINQVRKLFPRAYIELNKFISDYSKFELMFWHLGKEDQHLWQQLTLQGPCKIFFVCTQKKCIHLPGSVLKLKENETIEIKYNDMVYGFLIVFSK